MSWYLFLAPLGEQNITWMFINLRKYDGFSESVAFVQNWGILQTKMDQRGDHMKINFEYFQIQKWMLLILTVEKVDEKMGSFV